MSNVTHISAHRNTVIRHYAHLGDDEGIARLVPGGYCFTSDSTGKRILVAYNDVELLLHGLMQEDTETRPLWQLVADSATYNGTYRRDMVQGR